MGIALNEEIRRLLDGPPLRRPRHDQPGRRAADVGDVGGSRRRRRAVLDGRRPRKHRNLERDTRASVTVLDSDDPYNYVELRGRVTIEQDVGRAFDTGLSWKYDSRDPDPDPPGAVRLIVRMTADNATGYAS